MDSFLVMNSGCCSKRTFLYQWIWYGMLSKSWKRYEFYNRKDLLETFEDDSSKPVSAAFPPPHNTPEPDLSTLSRPKPDLNIESPTSATLQPRITSLRDGHTESEIPMIEFVSQDAIEELIETIFTFAEAQDPQILSRDEFERVVLHDMNILAWFEALGSIF